MLNFSTLLCDLRFVDLQRSFFSFGERRTAGSRILGSVFTNGIKDVSCADGAIIFLFPASALVTERVMFDRHSLYAAILPVAS